MYKTFSIGAAPASKSHHSSASNDAAAAAAATDQCPVIVAVRLRNPVFSCEGAPTTVTDNVVHYNQTHHHHRIDSESSTSASATTSEEVNTSVSAMMMMGGNNNNTNTNKKNGSNAAAARSESPPQPSSCIAIYPPFTQEGEVPSPSHEAAEEAATATTTAAASRHQKQQPVRNWRRKLLSGGHASQLTITNPKQHCLVKDRNFSFDIVLDSGTVGAEDGVPVARQDIVYEKLGTLVVDNAINGYNTCLFAYGQTGSGKTYTMVGDINSSVEKGLIVRCCEGLFVEMMLREEKWKFGIEVSYFEVYNEGVYDLLHPHNNRSAASSRSRANQIKHPLRVREDPNTGVFVEGLRCKSVSSIDEIIQFVKDGAAFRTTASTLMNNYSSRSHSVISIKVKQMNKHQHSHHHQPQGDDGDVTTSLAAAGKTSDTLVSAPSATATAQALISQAPWRQTGSSSRNSNKQQQVETALVGKINLVDLAGSERVAHTNTERLKEGSTINLSLTYLGIVMSALAESSTSAAAAANKDQQQQQQQHIPFRSSVLTWLLNDSLGGNSKTILLATVNPSSTFFDETLSTLRFAERAKKIILKPTVNVEAANGPNAGAYLTIEIEKLKRTMTHSMEEQFNARLREADEQRRALEAAWTAKFDELTSQRMHDRMLIRVDNHLPAFINMSSAAASGWSTSNNSTTFIFYLAEGATNVGSDEATCRVCLPELQPLHCVMRCEAISLPRTEAENDGDENDRKGEAEALRHPAAAAFYTVTMIPSEGADCFLNGAKVQSAQEQRLVHGDNVIFSPTCMFKLRLPRSGEKGDDDGPMDFRAWEEECEEMKAQWLSAQGLLISKAEHERQLRKVKDDEQQRVAELAALRAKYSKLKAMVHRESEARQCRVLEERVAVQWRRVTLWGAYGRLVRLFAVSCHFLNAAMKTLGVVANVRFEIQVETNDVAMPHHQQQQQQRNYHLSPSDTSKEAPLAGGVISSIFGQPQTNSSSDSANNDNSGIASTSASASVVVVGAASAIPIKPLPPPLYVQVFRQDQVLRVVNAEDFFEFLGGIAQQCAALSDASSSSSSSSSQQQPQSRSASLLLFSRRAAEEMLMQLERRARVVASSAPSNSPFQTTYTTTTTPTSVTSSATTTEAKSNSRGRSGLFATDPYPPRRRLLGSVHFGGDLPLPTTTSALVGGVGACKLQVQLYRGASSLQRGVATVIVVPQEQQRQPQQSDTTSSSSRVLLCADLHIMRIALFDFDDEALATVTLLSSNNSRVERMSDADNSNNSSTHISNAESTPGQTATATTTAIATSGRRSSSSSSSTIISALSPSPAVNKRAALGTPSGKGLGEEAAVAKRARIIDAFYVSLGSCSGEAPTLTDAVWSGRLTYFAPDATPSTASTTAATTPHQQEQQVSSSLTFPIHIDVSVPADAQATDNPDCEATPLPLSQQVQQQRAAVAMASATTTPPQQKQQQQHRHHHRHRHHHADPETTQDSGANASVSKDNNVPTRSIITNNIATLGNEEIVSSGCSIPLVLEFRFIEPDTKGEWRYCPSSKKGLAIKSTEDATAYSKVFSLRQGMQHRLVCHAYCPVPMQVAAFGYPALGAPIAIKSVKLDVSPIAIDDVTQRLEIGDAKSVVNIHRLNTEKGVQEVCLLYDPKAAVAAVGAGMSSSRAHAFSSITVPLPDAPILNRETVGALSVVTLLATIELSVPSSAGFNGSDPTTTTATSSSSSTSSSSTSSFSFRTALSCRICRRGKKLPKADSAALLCDGLLDGEFAPPYFGIGGMFTERQLFRMIITPPNEEDNDGGGDRLQYDNGEGKKKKRKLSPLTRCSTASVLMRNYKAMLKAAAAAVAASSSNTANKRREWRATDNDDDDDDEEESVFPTEVDDMIATCMGNAHWHAQNCISRIRKIGTNATVNRFKQKFPEACKPWFVYERSKPSGDAAVAGRQQQQEQRQRQHFSGNVISDLLWLDDRVIDAASLNATENMIRIRLLRETSAASSASQKATSNNSVVGGEEFNIFSPEFSKHNSDVELLAMSGSLQDATKSTTGAPTAIITIPPHVLPVEGVATDHILQDISSLVRLGFPQQQARSSAQTKAGSSSNSKIKALPMHIRCVPILMHPRTDTTAAATTAADPPAVVPVDAVQHALLRVPVHLRISIRQDKTHGGELICAPREHLYCWCIVLVDYVLFFDPKHAHFAADRSALYMLERETSGLVAVIDRNARVSVEDGVVPAAQYQPRKLEVTESSTNAVCLSCRPSSSQSFDALTPQAERAVVHYRMTPVTEDQLLRGQADNEAQQQQQKQQEHQERRTSTPTDADDEGEAAVVPSQLSFKETSRRFAMLAEFFHM